MFSGSDVELAQPEVTCLTFNHDGTCLAVGTVCGFSIYRVWPKLENIYEDYFAGGVSIVEFLLSSSLVATVGAGRVSTGHSSREVHLLDVARRVECFRLQLGGALVAVRLSVRRLVVATEDEVRVLDLRSGRLLAQFEARLPRLQRPSVAARLPAPHESSVFASPVALHPVTGLLAFACCLSTEAVGGVALWDTDCASTSAPHSSSSSSSSSSPFGSSSPVGGHVSSAPQCMRAHRHPTRHIIFNQAGTLLATSSCKVKRKRKAK
eukprot:GHVT01023771.1.p1 GENE.GHVT01023771.1~~GHVT01023771.1.p1  ORF type:complete len:265 (-),score=74.74 GHVT01023771.1:683-1477(-)